MFVSGHIQIINEVLKDILAGAKQNEYFKDEYLCKYNNINYSNLILGLSIIDLPCKKYKVDSDHMSISKQKLCDESKLIDLILNVGETQLFQYHLGYFAHLHATTTDPNNTVLKIRNKIIMSILGFCLLSVYDDTIFQSKQVFKPNIIWIGMILHIIQDSYSPAHTIRDKKIKAHVISKDKLVVSEDLKIELEIHEIIKTLAKSKIIYKNVEDLEKQLIHMKNKYSGGGVEEYIQKKIRSLYKIYKIFKFEYDTQKMVAKHVINVDVQYGYTGREQNGDIVNFQSYVHQPFGMHFLHDFLFQIKRKHNLYQRMKNECAIILELFKKVVETKDVKSFLNDIFSFTLNNTFHIHEKYLNEKTNKISPYF